MAHERLLVMRHAEKSDDPNDPDLTPAGQARAKALPPISKPPLASRISFLRPQCRDTARDH